MTYFKYYNIFTYIVYIIKDVNIRLYLLDNIYLLNAIIIKILLIKEINIEIREEYKLISLDIVIR